ncbi:MAG TPA: Gfo/Idh/MocA family oxidoreductase [Candidatus Polarisedimenticolia bacterium]|jgi:myo-inositol 2-dehydrogenase/D-chiro-inositol 1-dehydrogenase|nr:Gfo/Idh/MocA family oxidoreductase [Candidatus Polarisedimenticolia bacterium]
MKNLQVGLIGLGIHGSRYARHLAAGEVGGADLAVVSRLDRVRGEAQARELGVAYAPEYRSILDDPRIDAVVLALPPDLHARLVPEALEAGKAVLVEKPLAPDADSARRVVEAGRRSTRPAMVAQTLRFNSVVQAIRSHRARLGELRILSLSQRFEPSTRAWLDDPVAGGILRNTGVHSFDLIRFLSGLEVEEVLCFSESVLTSRTEDSFASVLRLEGGVLAVVENNRATASRSGRIELVGERGQLAADHVHHVLAEIRGTRSEMLDLPPPVATVRECLAAFVGAVRGEREVPIPLEEGLRAVEIVDACRESAEKKRPRRVAGRGLESGNPISPGS